MVFIKNILTLFVVSAAFSSCRSQSKIDNILSKPADSLNIANIDTLMKSGYVRSADPTIIGTYLVEVAQHNDTKNWTIGHLLDSVKARMKKMDDYTAAKHNHGNDSVFIRDPKGNRMFIGMGQLSFDKIVAKASANLPQNYPGDYNLKINSVENIQKLSVLISNNEHPVIAGNVLLNKRDSGELKNMKIGDLFEITKRVMASKEFAPFADWAK